MEKRKPLRKSIMLRCVLFIASLCIVLSIVNALGYRDALTKRYEAYITDILDFAASNIDVDDMEECLATGVKSEKYEETQALFDNIKDTCEIDYIYVIIPQNTEPLDNIMNVIAGMSSYEKINVPENEVQLGGLTGDDYTVETATKYFNAADNHDEIVFFEEWADRWGLEYTGIKSLYDSEGNYFAELCVDVPADEIRMVIQTHLIQTILIIVAIGALFTIIFLLWIKRVVTDPIVLIEENVMALADKSHGQTNPDELVLELPDINTQNELEALAGAISSLSKDLRDYLVNTIAARDNAAAAEKKAMELRQQATRDALTGIRNRHAYEAEIEKIEERIKEEGFSKFGIAMVDLNFLKKINDTYGHDRGNISIIKICMIVCKSFPHSPVFRIGGDEFVAIIENEDYEKINERISSFHETLEKIQADDSLEPWEKISAAIGWSFFKPEKDDGVETVFKRADEKMYENKRNMKAERS